MATAILPPGQFEIDEFPRFGLERFALERFITVEDELGDLPRVGVAFEERGRIVPGWILRYLYRPVIPRTIRQLRRALEQPEG